MLSRKNGLGLIGLASLSLMAHASVAALSAVSQDFEALDAENPAALGDLGWLVGANVFDASGGFLYNYFAFPAPNGSGAFSNVAVGEGGPEQGAQQLVVFSDYANGDHGGTNIIEANFFKEMTIEAADVGQTWTFTFDAKRGDISGASTALAFIKTLDPGAGFFVSNFLSVDTGAIAQEWGTYSIELAIDETLPGQILQIGFLNTASGFEPSGVFYDNIGFTGPASDSDGDGVTDDVDNCTNDANPLQVDSNGDNIGNVCDADIAGPAGPGFDDCTVNFFDLGRMKEVFFSSDADADLVGAGNAEPDGTVNFFDLGRMKQVFFGQPGPSAAGCN